MAGMAEAREVVVHHLGGVVVEAQIRGRAVAHFGQAVQEVAVGGGADAEAEDARGAEALVDRLEDLGLVADVAIGEE